MPPTPKVTNHAKSWTGTPAAPVQDSLRVVRGSPSGPGGIGGLLGRSHGYSAGNWSTHNFYHADGNGNVTYLVTSSQGLAAKYRYDPYGNTISSSGTLAGANVYRFSSKELHLNSGLYYYGFRFYDPNTQTWLNRDPISDEAVFAKISYGKSSFDLALLEFEARNNLYKFSHNSPLSYVDSNGHGIAIPIVIGGGGVILIGVVCALSPPCAEAARQLWREIERSMSRARQRCPPRLREKECKELHGLCVGSGYPCLDCLWYCRHYGKWPTDKCPVK